jgi:hypothetical protein
VWAKEYPPVGHNHLDGVYPKEWKHQRIQPKEIVVAKARNGGLKSRKNGVRYGFGGMLEYQKIVDAKALEEAQKIVALMVEKNMVDKDDAGNAALSYAIGVVRGENHSASTRLQAAKLVMDFTLAKPATKVDANLRAEDFLAQLASEVKAKESRED